MKRGFKQTAEPVLGKGSYHPIGLVRGQFGGVPEETWVPWLGETGFDGWEEASWELGLLNNADTPEKAYALAETRVAMAKKHGLIILSVATHLQGQVLGDEPSVRTLNFASARAKAAYKEWRGAGNEPPETDPYFVPAHVGEIMREDAEKELIAAAYYAAALAKLQGRQVPISGFTGSPCGRWNCWFEFPPPVTEIAGCKVEDPRVASRRVLVKRFKKFWETCKFLDVKFGLEAHPSEFAIGDLATAQEFIDVVAQAGFVGTVGFNLDASHMEWQRVSVVEFIKRFSAHIFSVHIKGVEVAGGYCENGILGGHQPMGHPDNGWNFTTPGTPRDAVPQMKMLVALNAAGYVGGVSIEWEDGDANNLDGAKAALRNVRAIDLPPAGQRHDEALKTA